MEIKKNEPDRRVIKTKKSIEEALLSLMFEKHYNKITIQDIIDRANVGRSTFYSHFTDKENLLLSSIEFLLEIIKNFVVNYIEQSSGESSPITIIDFFEHLQEHGKLIKGLIKADNTDMFFWKVQLYSNQKILSYFSSAIEKRKKENIPHEILANHISGTLINMIKWWIDNDMCYSPSQMDDFFRKLVGSCIDLA